jgi:PAS domain S-box-containing protein
LQSQISLINNGKQLKKGKESFIEGIDYRGEPVYAYINYLPKFNWFLIVKSDQNQAIKELSKFYYGIFGTILGATFIFIIAMTGIVKKEKEKFLREADQLRKQKELIKKQYEYIAKIANDAIIITDSQNRIIDYNDKFLQLYNIDSPQNLSLNFLDFVSDNLKNQWNDCLRNIKENDGLIFEAVHKTASGETFNVQVSARFIELEGNEFLIQIVRDFEERKRIEDELRSAKHKAEESDRLKSNFLSMMSHEVRTPINIILGAVDLLKSNLNQEIFQQNEHLFDMITRNGKRLLTLISDIIDISRIESNELKLEFIVRNVESLILDVISEYEQVARKKGLQIITNFKAQNPYARIDEVRFIQIISNLINNAIKFTSQGGITVITENVGESIHISVKDTGIGIPEQALKDIFKMFRQAHEGYGRNFEGAGLGLTITQKLTKMMGGEIKVESQVNVGSTFTVIFPAIKSEELDENLLRTLEERHKNSYKPFILIVNNDKDEAFYLESLMIRLGFEYLTINEGKKIISVIKHKPADCIIYSVNLQNETETEKVMEEIRKKAKLENLKIIALRSPDTIISEWRLKEIGFNLVKTKPISFEDISKILYQVLSIKN